MSLGYLLIISIIIYQLCKSLIDGDVIYNPTFADYSKTFLIEYHQKWILMMYILSNMIKWPPDCTKNIMVEIKLKIDV